MIYEFSNFVDNYSNADGESKERMAISQFSKILGQSPKTIEVAIADADIPVRENASMPEMIEIIKANVGNKKLKYHPDFYTVVENIDLKEAKTLAPNINQDFISIKSIITSGNTSAIFGILDVEGKLIMVPLKILNTW